MSNFYSPPSDKKNKQKIRRVTVADKYDSATNDPNPNPHFSLLLHKRCVFRNRKCAHCKWGQNLRLCMISQVFNADSGRYADAVISYSPIWRTVQSEYLRAAANVCRRCLALSVRHSTAYDQWWVEHSNSRIESIRFVKKSAFRFTSCHAVFLAYLWYYFQLPFTV